MKELIVASGDNPYAYGEASINDLVKNLLNDQPPKIGTGDVACYLIDGTNPYSDIGRGLAGNVFNVKFNKADPAFIQREYDQYESVSQFIIAVDVEQQRAAGTLRMMNESDIGFRSLNLLASSGQLGAVEEAYTHHLIDDKQCVIDIGSTAVAADYRKQADSISVYLYRAMRVASQQQKVKHWLATLSRESYRNLVSLIGLPFEFIMDREPYSYIGKDKDLNYPVYSNEEKMYEHFDNMASMVKCENRLQIARKAFALSLFTEHDKSIQF